MSQVFLDALGAGCRLAAHLDYPKYVVSDDGRVFSLVQRQVRQLTPGMRGKYRGFTLVHRSGALRSSYQHRLVAETFHGLPGLGMETRHLDGDRFNNSASNLAWGTRSENMRDKERHGTAPLGERHPMAKLDTRTVRVIRGLHHYGFDPKRIMRRFGISKMTHYRIVKNQSWKGIGVYP
jgi:hypothetical protein